MDSKRNYKLFQRNRIRDFRHRFEALHGRSIDPEAFSASSDENEIYIETFFRSRKIDQKFSWP